MTRHAPTRRLVSAMLAGLGASAHAAFAKPEARPRVTELLLDGDWRAGFERHYDRTLKVPGLATDPAKPTPGTLWYRREVELPAGDWTHATLVLKGARFAPAVYIDGVQVSTCEGGMAPTHHRFTLPTDGAKSTHLLLEIALKSLLDLDPKDASCVPQADRWRNNQSSYLWDSVVLRLHAEAEIVRVLPFSDLAYDQVRLKWDIIGALPQDAILSFDVRDAQGKVLVEHRARAADTETLMAFNGRLLPWSPQSPNLYRLRSQLFAGKALIDRIEQPFGQRQFSVEGLGFRLNGKPCPIRMGTVVWHRWTRDPEAQHIAFDTAWFEANVVKHLKDLGANALRFHLGLPPEALLDLCDQHGLLVQMEWPFFHGIAASQTSMDTQWRAWLDMAARHPSIVIMHPWNETGGDQLKPADAAIDALRPLYPPLVMSHRELTPVHKYWWSLFENLGLYYDSASQFHQAVMVDEFGGNYLDGNGDPGLYPTTRETFLRFLGRNHSRTERLDLHAQSNARVAEYWRRLGVAGFSPFTILGSREDGSHWYLGPTNVAAPQLKPVWAALSAAFAEVSLSLEIWNHNFLPNETVSLPLWLFNEALTVQTIRANIHIVDASGVDAMPALLVERTLWPNQTVRVDIEVVMPMQSGEWRIEARLDSSSQAGKAPVVSSWDIRTLTPVVPPKLKSAMIGVAAEETELRALFSSFGLRTADPKAHEARLLVGSKATWASLQTSSMREDFDKSLKAGKSVVLLDAGPQPLGAGYMANGLGGPLEGAPTVNNPATLSETALFGIKASFVEMAEPESCLHPAVDSSVLWSGLPKQATWLWNGLRGGLIVPAADMQITGLSGNAVLSLWQTRGADTKAIIQGNYYAFELAGYYAFSANDKDSVASSALRQRVSFLVEDAPALASAINPNAPLKTINLHAEYLAGQSGGKAQSLTPLANAGKNLSRTPVMKLTFEGSSGQLVISQLLTAGRLLPGVLETGPGVYGRRHDPATVQFVLNILNEAI